MDITYKPFAWHGINLRIPEDWDMSALSGDYKEGYFRLDNPEDVCIEVKWRREKKKVDLDGIVKKYMTTLQKPAKKEKTSFSDIGPREELNKVFLKDKEIRRFAWKSGNSEFFNLVSQCNYCHTIMMVQVPVTPGRLDVVSKVLRSLEDHYTSDFTHWAVYDFKFSMPSDFNLEKSSLKSGYLEFNFYHSNTEMKLRRWGLADIILRDIDLQDWSRTSAPKLLRSVLTRAEKTEEPPHENLRVSTRRLSWYAFYVYHCRKANKLYALDYKGKKDEALLNRVISSIQCH